MDSNKIAKNIIFLNIRMFLMMLIALYTSRVVLDELGIEDYGIYGVVGGVIMMFSSLRGIFSSSMQRFFNFYKGKGEEGRLLEIFNMGVIIHIVISIVFLIIAETIGSYLFTKLELPPDRIDAAHLVFQLSIVSSIITIMTVPFDALIIANEKFDFYAILSIIEGLLKLSIVLLLPFIPFDKLKVYAILILLVSIIIRSSSSIYSRRNFKECKYKLIWNKELFKEMSSFSAWHFLGKTTFVLVNEGINLLLNVFGGVAINAARGIAYQVRSMMDQVLNTVSMAIKPQIVHLYAKEEEAQFQRVICFYSKFTFLIYLVLFFPSYVFIDNFLSLWLKNVPEFSAVFIKVILVFLLVRVLNTPIGNAFVASGKIKRYQVIEMILLSTPLLLAYFLLKYSCPFYTVFIAMTVIETINLYAIILLSKKELNFDVKLYLKTAIFPIAKVFLICSLFVYFTRKVIDGNSWVTVILLSFLFVCITVLTAWIVAIETKERVLIKRLINSFVSNKK